jgi:very-short-patch-repair endonuclease
MKCNPGEGQGMRGPDRKMVRIARRLRVNQTDAETVLWNRIRNRQVDGHKFMRQLPLEGYVCDFVCREKSLIVEVDGGQHNESLQDEIRDRKLNAAGFKVLRFWNNDVLGNLEGVLITIQGVLSGCRCPSPQPSPRKSGERERESVARIPE